MQALAQMADHAATQITASHTSWTDFLKTAARLYKYPYHEQLMIYAQRPDATACADYEVWNEKMRRYVRRGSKGIALIDTSGDKPRLHYVFDISDTGGGGNSRRPFLWQYRPEHEDAVTAALEREYEVSGEKGLSDQLEQIAGQMAKEYWQDHQYDILHIVDDSFLEEYDDFNIGVQFRNAAAVSITYALMSRCGLEPDEYFEHEDFLSIFDFNTPSTVAALGTAVSEGSQKVLQQIEVSIKNYEREHLAERSATHGEQPDLHEERGLPDSGPDDHGADREHREIREDAQELSDGASSGPVQQPAVVGEAVPAPAGDRADGDGAAGPDDAGADEVGGRDGEPESLRPDEMGGPHEQPESPGRGNDTGRTYLQLTLFPSEQEQIQRIDEAESVKPSAFAVSQADIDDELRRGTGYEGGKLRIYALYQHGPDIKAAVSYLKKEYGYFGHSHTFLDNSQGFVNYSTGKGMTIQRYEPKQETTVKWNAIDKRLRTVIAEGGYLTAEEKAQYAELERDYAGLESGVPMPIARYGFPEPQASVPDTVPEKVSHIFSFYADYETVKQAHPDDMILYQAGDFFELYGEDAEAAAELLHIDLTMRPISNAGRVSMCGVPASQLEQVVEQLRDRYDVTVSLMEADSRERRVSSLPSIDNEARNAIDEHEAEYGADGWRAFPGNAPDNIEPAAPVPPRKMTQANIDAAIQKWNGDKKSKQRTERYMIDHARDKDTAVWLQKEFGGDYPMFTVPMPGVNQSQALSWTKVQRHLAKLVKEDRFFTEIEQDNLDNIDTDYIRERLAESGIVNGEVVDEEKLNNNPFIRQVTADAERIAQEEQAAQKEVYQSKGGVSYRAGDQVDALSADNAIVRLVIDHVDDNYVYYTMPSVPDQEPVNMFRDRFEGYLDDGRFTVLGVEPERQAAPPDLSGQPITRTGDTITIGSGDASHEMDVTLSDEQWAAVQQAVPEITAFTPPYKVGDTVYLDDTPFEITNIGSFDIQLRDPALIYPIFRSESRENFERLLRQDSRNGPITEFLAADLEHTDADLREALTSGLLEQKDKENIAGYFRENEGNTRVAQRLSDTYAGTSETMELTTGDTADIFATTTGFEINIHDKYGSKRNTRWEEIAPILRALYEQEQDGFFHEPVLRKPANLDGKPSYQAGDQAVLDYGGHELSGTVGYVGEKDVRIDTGPYSWSHQTVSRDAFENGIRQDERNADLFTPEQPAAENFHITDDHLGEGGAKVKYGYNIAAIRTLKAIEAEGRTATPEEQETLSRYVGWGGIPQAFDPDNTSWSKEYAELKEVLTDEEYEMARASTLNAHYTSPAVIKAIYEAVGKMGFQTGTILEPACGVGNFFGLLPEEMSASKLYGVELDSITGRIAKQLYPDSDITVAGFETTDRRDFFDLAVGNVPFGQYQVNDRAYNKLGFSIHDYFFAKTLDQVRSGGVIAFITSRYTMDKQSPEVRRYIARRAELLGAIRLPNNAFKANAGTEVVSDIIFLQKRDRPIEIEPDWVHLGQNEDGFAINSYFIKHPEMILGRQTSESTQYGRQDFTVAPIEGLELADQLHDAVKYIHGQYTEAELPDLGENEEIDDSIPADPDVKNYSYTVVDGKVYYRENSRMVRPELNDTAKERVRGMVELRDCVHKLIGQQLDGFIADETIRETQAELNRLYDNFTAKYGLINSRGNSLAFSEDSSYYLLCSLEVIDEDGSMERKADMFTKRTIKQQRVVTAVDTASEALALSIAEKARVDMDYMASLTGKTPETLADELRGVIFRLPEPVGADENPCYVTSDEYLSGNVREKLREAKRALAVSDEFQPNVEALKAAQPKDLDASEIEVRLGATWIGREYIQEFMYELLNPPSYLRNNIQVNYAEFTAEWNITGKNSVGYNNVAAYVTYGTDRANAYRILEDTLNLRDVRIYDTVTDPDGKERRVLNSKETTLAQQKQQAIKDAFQDWIWKDPERRQTLTKKYNELFNSCRPREYDGRHITFSGINPEITLREHQLNAVAHILYGGNTLLAHEVGAGKTFEMVAAAMESKRLGLCQKSLFAVPNHLTEQWASEFLRLYPSANILVATKKDFETRNRKKFCARIATGDYDAVIIGHSQFERIPVSIERQERLLQEQIWEIEDGLEELKDSGAERFTIKQLERTKKGLETRLKKLNDTSRKDDVVTFEQLGVDRLYVDEAHNYKNLFLYTKMRNVAGLSTSDAQKSSDMLLKCRYIDEITDSRGVVFATGTPVSNSMTELYTMMRYLQHGTLQQQGLAHFDCWASTFGETTTAIELAPEGTGYRARTRFAKFFNLPELMTLWKEAADIKTADQLDLPTPTPVYHNEVAQPTDIQKEMVQELSKRAALVHSGTVDPSVDNMLKITSDGRKLGLDQRIINPMLPDDPGSKVNMCVNNIYHVWDKGEADKLTQLVFCDISTPKGHTSQQAAKAVDKTINGVELHALEDTLEGTLEQGAESDAVQFTVYDDIRVKLIARGIPAEQIAFIHDANTEVRKKELFAKVRAGQVRVLMGSTFKMGAGMNVQDRLVALHDLDCPWRPGDLEQRSGRIIRQGNGNPEVHIFRYVTEGTFDAYLWQTIENKQKFISQIMTSKSPVRSCEDIDETALSYAEIKALCAGDERIKEKMDLDIDVSKLRLLKASHQSQQYRLEDNLLKYFPEQIERNKGFIAGLESDMKTLAEHPHPKDGFAGMVVRGDTLTDKDNAGAAILEACKEVKGIDPLEIGSYRGFSMSLSVENFGREFVLTLKGQMTHRVTLGTDARGNLTRIDNALASMPERIQNVHSQLENLRSQMEAAKAEIGKPFPQEAELQEKSARLAELNALLDIDGKAPAQQQAENVVAKSERPSVLESLKAPCVCGSAERKTKHEIEAR